MMRPKFSNNLVCSFEIELREADAASLSLPVVGRISLLGVTLQVDFEIAAGEFAASPDPEKYLRAASMEAARRALLEAVEGRSPASNTSAALDTIHGLKAELASVTAKYDALLLGKMGVLHD